jgi:hypothetical protein
MKKLHLMSLAALLAAPVAFAGDMPAGQFAGYATMTAIDVDGVVDDDGTGFGLRGWGAVNDAFFVHGEYQTTSIGSGDLESLRLGGGLSGPMGGGNAMWLVKGEYVDFGSDADEDGFGAHGGVMFQASPQFGVYGTLGYLSLTDSDGLEFDVGAQVNFTREFAGVIDYRAYMGEYDVSGIKGDYEVTDLRIGVAYNFY